MESKRVATLTLDDGRTVEFPIFSGTLGPDVIDISALGKLGIFTYDPAFFSTSSFSASSTHPYRTISHERYRRKCNFSVIKPAEFFHA